MFTSLPPPPLSPNRRPANGDASVARMLQGAAGVGARGPAAAASDSSSGGPPNVHEPAPPSRADFALDDDDDDDDVY